MAKKYLKWQFRQWWPFLLVFSLLMFIYFSFSIITASMSKPIVNNEVYLATDGTILSLFYPIFILGLIATLIMPFFVYSFRVKGRAVDTFYQAELKDSSIRRIRLFLGLLIILASFSAAFILGSFFFLLRYIATPLTSSTINPYTGVEITYQRMNLSLYAFIPAYFLILFSLTASYFMNCFFVSLGDYVLDQLFLLVFGNLIAISAILFPYLYCMIISGQDLLGSNAFLYGFSIVGDFATLGEIHDLLIGNSLILEENLSSGWTASCLISCCLHLLCGVGAFLYCYFRADPSGECADRKGARNKAIAFLPHIAAFFLSFLLSSGLFSLFSIVYVQGLFGFFYILFYAVIYYALLSLWRHSWKPAKVDLIAYLCVCGNAIILWLVRFISLFLVYRVN